MIPFNHEVEYKNVYMRQLLYVLYIIYFFLASINDKSYLKNKQKVKTNKTFCLFLLESSAATAVASAR